MGRSLALALTAITAIFAVLLGTILAFPPVLGPPMGAEEIRPGVPVVRHPNGSRADFFTLQLRAGDFLRVTVEQQGIDVVVSLLDAGGITLLTVDSPNGTSGPETLVAVAESSGWHRLRIHALPSEEHGRYAVRVEEPHPAGSKERQLARATQAFAKGEELLAQKDGRELVRARKAYETAADGWRSAAEDRSLAVALDRLGDVAEQLGEPDVARPAYQEAAQIQGRLGAPDEVRLYNKLGQICRLLGDPRAAEDAHLRALRRAASLGHRRGEGVAWNELGHLYKSEAAPQKAIKAYDRALTVWEALGDEALEEKATALHNLGTVYSTLGSFSEARELLERALALRQKAEDLRGQAATITAIAWIEGLEKQLPEALRLYEEAIELRRREKDWRGAAATLDRRGTALRQVGRTDEALASYRQALEFFEQSGERGLIAHPLSNLGGLLVQKGDLAEGERLLMQALQLFRQSSDQESEAFVLQELAQAARQRGDLPLALDRIEEAIGLVESLRRAAPGPELRVSYASLRHGYFELWADLLMELDERQPGRGFDVRALEASERGRGRGLQENLEEKEGWEPGSGEDVGLLNARIRALENLRIGLQEADAPPDQIKAIERKILTLLAERNRLRAQPPVREASLREPRLEEIRQLLGEDTILLEYALGEERSFLWSLDANGLETSELPGRAALERQVQQTRELLSRSHYRTSRKPAEIAAADLGKILLGPVAHLLTSQRVLIVPDGALYSIPFAALPVQRGGAPLLADHEIVFAPSASLIVRMRRELSRRPPLPKLLAMVADPVFEGDDPRLRKGKAGASAGSTDIHRGSGPRVLRRLPQTGVEALEILKLAPPDQRLAALGFEADRQAVLDGLLKGFRILHFATHAVLNPEQPELSSLVLTQVDPEGRPRDGSLRAYEIRDLDLSAELVVLSACSTGLGPEMRGEGPMGLTRAFLDAGAERVVMSLWDVEDTATKELMSRFYQGVLVDELSPASALRQAQLSMRAEARWAAPYYWAGFVLQGDWK